jgi:hypothetical protein
MWTTDVQTQKAVINGREVVFNSAQELIDGIKRVAREAGYQAFRVVSNGREISPSEITSNPDSFNGASLEIQPYYKAGK